MNPKITLKCRLEDIRRDDRGYYCDRCGRRMAVNWNEILIAIHEPLEGKRSKPVNDPDTP